MEKTWCIGPHQVVREQRIEEDCYAVIEGKTVSEREIIYENNLL